MSSSAYKLTCKGSKFLPKYVRNPEKTRLYSEIGKIDLKPIKKIEYKFDPFDPKSFSIRELMFHLSSKQKFLTNRDVFFKTEVLTNCVKCHHSSLWGVPQVHLLGITDSIEYFNPITGIWTEAESSLRVPRCFARLSSSNGKLFIVGGMDSEGCSMGSIDVLEERSTTWKQIDEMEIPRHGHELCTINSCMIIIGGSNSKSGETVTKIECYCQSKMAVNHFLSQLPDWLVWFYRAVTQLL